MEGEPPVVDREVSQMNIMIVQSVVAESKPRMGESKLLTHS